MCINNAIITNAIIYKKIPWNAFYLCTIWLWQINYSCGYLHEYKNLINYINFDENLEKSSVSKKSEGQSRINVNLLFSLWFCLVNLHNQIHEKEYILLNLKFNQRQGFPKLKLSHRSHFERTSYRNIQLIE